MPHIEERLLEDESILQLEVVLTKEDLLPKVQSEIKRIATKGNIKGFRPGHVPKELIRHRYGDGILADVFQERLEEVMNEFWKKNTRPLIGDPILINKENALPSLRLNKIQEEYRVCFEVGLYPSEVKGLSLQDEYEKIVLDVPEERLAGELKKIALSEGEDRAVEDGAAIGDAVEVDAVELSGEQLREGGWQNRITFSLLESTPEDIKEAFLGRSAGDSLRVRLGAWREAVSEYFFKRQLGIPDEWKQEVGDWFEVSIVSILRREPAPLTEELFQKRLGPSVHTQEQAFEVLRKAIESNYTDIIAQDFVDNVLRHLEQINPIALPDRYMRALFRTKLEGDPFDVQQYENFLRAHKRRFLLDRLKELTQAYPDKEAVVREVVDQAYEYLQMIGLEHLLESFVRRMLDDPEVTRKAYERLTYRLIAAALPQYVRIKERHMRPEQLDEWRRRMRESAEQSPAASVAGKLPLTSADETA